MKSKLARVLVVSTVAALLGLPAQRVSLIILP
jgi:hypothetical protein